MAAQLVLKMAAMMVDKLVKRMAAMRGSQMAANLVLQLVERLGISL